MTQKPVSSRGSTLGMLLYLWLYQPYPQARLNLTGAWRPQYPQPLLHDTSIFIYKEFRIVEEDWWTSHNVLHYPSGSRLAMYFRGISLQNYRNLKTSSLGLGKGFFAILGKNGQGKSNLLEALQFLCDGKPYRTERDKDTVGFGFDFCRLEAKVVREEQGDIDLAIKITPEGKTMTAYGSAIARLSKYSSETACVLFTSDDVNIVLGEPSERRDYINQAGAMVSQGYLFDLNRFKRVLEQKNRILKQIRDGEASADSLDVWDQQLADYGGRVCARRARFIRQIAATASEYYRIVSEASEALCIAYEPSVEAPESPDKWPEALYNRLMERRSDEITRGMTLVGPQRDDLGFYLDEHDARKFASRGQARSIALAIRLAQASVSNQISGQSSIILMDDVFVELDASRRQMLAELVSSNEQVFITSAARSDLPESVMETAGILTIDDGVITVEKLPGA